MKEAAMHGSQAMESSTTIVAANSHDVLDLDSADLGRCVSANEADQSQEKSPNPSVLVATSSRETEKDLLTLSSQQVRNVCDVPNWRLQVERLSQLRAPLLAVGTDKAPIHLVTGRHLSRWQQAAFKAEQIAESGAAIGCGVRTGNGLLVFDVDGVTALEWLLDHNCDPRATKTWQIHRDTDPNRFKVAFTLTTTQQQQFGNAKPKEHTKDAVKDDAGNVIEKGEAVEVFHSTGGQVVVLGQHHDSGGNYYWPDGLAVEELAPIPTAWWQAALTIAGDTTTKAATTKARSTGKGDWRSLNPCPICGRDTTGYCSQHKDGKTIRCFHGSTFKPPMGLKPGDEITDKQGTIWAFSKVQGTGDEFSVFVAPDPDRRRKTARTSKPAITSTGIQAVLDARGSGWRQQKEGPPMRSKMAIGDLSGRLTSELGSRLGFDEVALMPAVDRVPLKDWEVTLLHGELSEAGWIIGSEAAEAGLLLAARRNPFHPVREYLKRVEADPAIAAFDLDQVAPRFFRAASALHKAMVRKWLIGAVARAIDPGCQMDYCLVLQSDVQGIGKSSELRELASPEWFTSTIPDQDKDWTLNVHCCWIFELAELESLTGAKAAGKIKNMLTTTTDLVRVPYGKVPERMKRPSVFCATVNKRVFLRDDTGNRRFWVVPIEGTEKLDRAGLAEARDGIWKSAVLAYRSGELPMLPDGLADASEHQNDDFREQDVWMPLLTKYLSRRQQEQHIPVQSCEFLDHIGMASERQNTHHGKRVRELAESLGWRHQQKRAKGGERKLGLWPQVATSATSATGVATGLNTCDANAFNGVATSATSKSQDQSLKTKKQEQEQPSGDLCSFFPVAEVATRPNGSDANASGHVATHLPPTCRQPLEQRIRELGHSKDLSGWSDEELPDLLQTLEQAAKRRASGFAIPVQEAA
jgi:predicted P-loop ATPase